MNIQITKFRMLDNFLIKAVASILIDGQLAVHDIKIFQYSPEKLVVEMPNKPDKQGVYRDMVHPVNKELRAQLTTMMIERYKQEELKDAKNFKSFSGGRT